MSGLRDVFSKDLAKLVGQLPVMCGWSADAQTVECAWRTQRDEVRFESIGILGESPHEIIVSQAALGRKPEIREVLWVSGHRYRVKEVTSVDCVSYIITLDRSDQ